MRKTLGLDLGSNSLGWAILDDITLDIVDKGVIVFPEGVDLDAGNSLETPAAERRAKRMGRRMKFRRKMRKWHLLKLLIDAKMCPLTHAELEEWQKQGKYPLDNRAFLDWLKSTDTDNPYCDRDAASRKKVDPFVLGRALYHLCQRRGFKSSRKDEAAQYDEETGELKKPDKETGKVKGDISALTDEINKAGCRTLGQYFFKCLESEKSKFAKTRIRCRYTGRVEHYENEFAVIMDVQGYAASDTLREKLHDAIFKQRPLRSQKHLVGNCPLETRNPRAQIGHPAFEEFRMLAFVNNLTLEDEDGKYRDELGNPLYPLTQEERDAICDAIVRVKKPTFKTIKKIFKERFAKGLQFHYYKEDDAIPSCQTRLNIAEAFGKVPYDEQKVFDALMFFDDTEMLKVWLRNWRYLPRKLNPGEKPKPEEIVDEGTVEKLISIHPKEGNAKYSLKAINKILPYLRRGFELSHARFCAKLPDIVPDYTKNESEVLLHIEETYRQHRRAKVERAATAKQIRDKLPELPTLHERYAEMLERDFGVTPSAFNKLYLRNDEAYEPETCYYPHGKSGECVKLTHPRLPPVQLGMIRNPLVQRSMTTLRRLVNYLSEHGKLDADDTIRIELARSVNDFATRKAYQEWQKERRALHDKAIAEIVKYGKAPTEDAIERYVLAEEQGWMCLYTGRKISISELLDGNSFDVEHTLPRSLSGDDALVNKTICDATYNRQVKQGRVPHDCPKWDEINTRLRPWREHLEELEKTSRNQLKKAKNASDPAAKSRARVKALVTKMERDYWREKLRRFDLTMNKLTARDGEGLGFKRRQLVDTGIMCSHAVDLLKCIYPKTFAVNGAATAFARKAWGIQSDEAKDRSEHTHHAKDAMVIAALTPARFTAICTALKDDGAERKRECDVCPPPCEGFADKVRHATDEILVKHILRQTTLRQSSKRNALAHAHPQKSDPTKTVKYVLSKGDTVRGQLHEETYYGKIVNPKDGVLVTVKREPIAGKKVSDVKKICNDIIDSAIRKIVESAIVNLTNQDITVIPSSGINMPSGVPIKKVRVKITGSRQNPLKIHAHSHKSKCEYKNFLYAASARDSNFRMAIYSVDGQMSYKTESVLEWAKNHKNSDYLPLDKQEGFVGYVRPGSMAIVVDDSEDASKFSLCELRRRLYYIRALPTDKEARGELQYHLVAVPKTDIIDKSSKLSPLEVHQLIRATAGNMFRHLLFEDIHFRMMLDGTIKFL